MADASLVRIAPEPCKPLPSPILQIPPKIMSIAVMLGASAAFISPFGYQCNLMVFRRVRALVWVPRLQVASCEQLLAPHSLCAAIDPTPLYPLAVRGSTVPLTSSRSARCCR